MAGWSGRVGRPRSGFLPKPQRVGHVDPIFVAALRQAAGMPELGEFDVMKIPAYVFTGGWLGHRAMERRVPAVILTWMTGFAGR